MISQHTQKYNPQIHHRRSIRLKEYDYSQAGAYFITICCHERKCRFGKIVEGKMVLNNLGVIAYDQWLKLTERFTNIELDVFQIMPNHMHGIMVINVGAGLPPALSAISNAIDDSDDADFGAGASPAPTAVDDSDDANFRAGANPANTAIGGIVGAYKSSVANACLKLFKISNKTMGKLWLRNYYEHIIRNEKAYQAISNYIINNPEKWSNDKFFYLTKPYEENPNSFKKNSL